MAGKMTQSQIMKELATATGSSTKAAKTFVTSFADMAVRDPGNRPSGSRGSQGAHGPQSSHRRGD
jgi:hypothetical protein